MRSGSGGDGRSGDDGKPGGMLIVLLYRRPSLYPPVRASLFKYLFLFPSLEVHHGDRSRQTDRKKSNYLAYDCGGYLASNKQARAGHVRNQSDERMNKRWETICKSRESRDPREAGFTPPPPPKHNVSLPVIVFFTLSAYQAADPRR